MTQTTDLEEEVKRLREWLENIYQCADEHEGEGHLGRMATRALKGDEPQMISESQTTDPLPISPMVDRVMNRFHVKLVERRVNERLGGDATIGELVQIMIEMGWQPPHRATTEVVQDVKA